MDNSQDIFSTAEAAEYLGLSVATVRYHIYEAARLKPDRTVGREFIFTRATLDAFKNELQAEGLTLQEAADLLGVPRNWVHVQFHRAKRLTPVGKRGKSWVFSKSDVEALRPFIGQDGRKPSASEQASGDQQAQTEQP